MEFRVLGPLDVRTAGGTAVEPGGPRQRAVLAALLLRANEPAVVGYLAEAVWERPPARPASNLRTYVAGLRQRLQEAGDDSARLSTRSGAYLLTVAAGELDLLAFEELAAAGDGALRAGDPAAAAATYGRALALWRGRALEGQPLGALLGAELARLEERRLTVVEQHNRARLQLGGSVELAGDLRQLVTEQPLREELWCQLMLALSQAGRRADALAAYQEVYQLLDAELGVQPGEALRRVHARVLTGEPERTEDFADIRISRRAPAQLPPEVEHYFGRADELAAVVELCTTASTALPVVAVTGQAGVGKTAFAVRAAHRLAQSFPDGQLYVDLLGAGPRPGDQHEVLGRFLRDLGVGGVDIPGDTAERAGMFRDRVAGRKVLLLLDNAASEEQVRALLPGNPECAVLVTSRRRLTGLDVSHRVQLGALPAEDSVRLLGELGGTSAEEVPAAHRIAQLCGGLPLALRIVGTKLRSLPHLTATGLADRLEDERHRLDELTTGDREVRAGFLVCHERLGEPERTAFQLLALLPGPDFPVWAAAAVLGTDPRSAERRLEKLVEANLLESGVRYRFHDLLRLFAEEQAEQHLGETEREAARSRLHDAYLYLGKRADAALDFGGLHQFDSPAPPVDLTRAASDAVGDAAAWFDHEHPSLLAAIEEAAAAGRGELVCHLAAVLAAYLELRAKWAELTRVAELTLAVARPAGDKYWMAYACFAIGLAAREKHEVETAQRFFGDCLALLPEVGDVRLEVVTLLSVGVGRRFQSRFDEAAACFARCLSRLAQLNEPRWTAYTLREVGILHRYHGRWDDAEHCLRQGADEFVLLGDRRWEAACLRELGVVRRERGDLAGARRLLTTSQELFHALGDIRREAASWRSLAYTHRELGDLAEARRCCRRSAELFGQTLDAHGSACTQVLTAELGADAGAAMIRQALEVFELAGDRRWSGKARLSLAKLYEARGEFGAADAERSAALALLTPLGLPEARGARGTVVRR